MAMICIIAMLTAACVGSVPRASFEADLRERGGGITGPQLELAVDLAAAEVAVDDADELEVLALTADARSRVIVIAARRGDQPDFVDTVTVRDDEVLAVSPVQNAGDQDLDAAAFPVASIPTDDAVEFVDRAIEAFGDPDTLVSTYRVTRQGDDVVIFVDVESPRRTGSVEFDADGGIIEVTS